VGRCTWAGDELVSSRAIEHSARCQRRGLFALAACAVAWYVYPLGMDRRFAAILAAVAVAGVVVEWIIVTSQHERGDRSADELIERGFRPYGRTDPVSRSVDRRISELTDEEACRRLAGLLRWYVELELTGTSPLGAKASLVPPVRGLGANAALVERIARRMERGPCDPRVQIRLHRLLTAPPIFTGYEPNVRREDAVRATLIGVDRLLDPPDVTRPLARS